MTDLFYEIPGNPVPQNASGGFFKTADGHRIRYACFGAVGRPLKGTVILLNGRNECIEKYFETIGDLSDRGFAVATLDWRGQGGSDRMLPDRFRGHVRSFDEYTADLDQFFEDIILPDCRGPYYVLAHSTGALIALLGSPSMVNRVRRMVLLTPFFGYPGFPLSMLSVRRIASTLYYSGLGTRYGVGGPRPKVSAPFESNRLTTDPERFARNQLLYERHPNLALGGPTVAWIRAAGIAISRVWEPEFMARMQVPSLFIGAGADTVVSTPLIAEYARRLRGGSLLTIDGARHELLQEADIFREQLFAAFDAFIPGSDEPEA